MSASSFSWSSFTKALSSISSSCSLLCFDLSRADQISSLLLRFPEVVTLDEEIHNKAGDTGGDCKQHAVFVCSREDSLASVNIKLLCVSLFATLSLINSILSKCLQVGDFDAANPDLNVRSIF